jgi:hypothetical protein
MAREVTTTGSKKLKTLKKEFNEHFPYLSIHIHSSEMALKAQKGETIYSLDKEKTLTEVREKTGSGSISFSGRKKVKTIEQEFNEIFGLYVQICYTDAKGARYYTTGSGDEKTLTESNRDKEAAGCKKDMWE